MNALKIYLSIRKRKYEKQQLSIYQLCELETDKGQ